MMSFGKCPVCGLKFGRKTTFCPKCLIDASDEENRKISISGRGKGLGRNIFFLKLAMVAAIGIILFIFFRAGNLGLSLIH